MKNPGRSPADRLVVFVAQGFGIGTLPFAPGTFGTLLGIVWIFLLTIPQSVIAYTVGTIAGLLLAVWIGGRAEQVLEEKDPGSIVIDEIAALPVAFAGALMAHYRLPFVSEFHRAPTVWELIGSFVLFRIFDITKPLFIGRSQNLPGGWGLVVDDLLAAIAVALIIYLVRRSY